MQTNSWTHTQIQWVTYMTILQLDTSIKYVIGMVITVLLTWYLDVFQDILNYSILLHMSHMYKLMERYVSVKKQ